MHSPVFPGGSLYSALLHRRLMTMADLGDASAMIGDRWAVIASEFLIEQRHTQFPVPGKNAGTHFVEEIVRLDSAPGFSQAASRRGLRNPDLLAIGHRAGRPTIQAIDAKFSVETARSKQVSQESVAALMVMQPEIEAILGTLLPAGAQLLPGIFVSPDTHFSRYVVKRGRGITKVQVQPDEVWFHHLDAERMFGELEAQDFSVRLHALDGHRRSPDEDAATALYYFRLVRAAVGNWRDLEKPLLSWRDTVTYDADRFGATLEQAMASADTAFDAIERSTDLVATVRRDRVAVERAASLPIANSEFKEWVKQDVETLGVEAPSLNQVRKQLGSWYRQELRKRVGPVQPPVANIRQALLAIDREAALLKPLLREQTRLAVENVARRQALESTDPTA